MCAWASGGMAECAVRGMEMPTVIFAIKGSFSWLRDDGAADSVTL